MTTLSHKVLEINLSTILNRVRCKVGMEDGMLTQAETLYRQYLELRAKHPSMTLVPPKLADYIWHEHMLSSKQYMEDCQALFGEYLHHHEEDSAQTLEAGWENSKNLYKQEFGVLLEQASLAPAGCR